jgi:ABC-type nitrate/sulfonate/bicarbonate transport system permease component
MVSMEAASVAAPIRLPGRALRLFNLPGILFLVALAVVWQLAMSAGLLTSQFLPTPLEIADAFVDLTKSGAMTSNLGHTVYVTLVGWLAAAVIGIALGLLLGLSTTTWRFSMATAEFLRALPAIAFVPVAVLLLGFSVRMELVVVIYVSVWPVLVNTVHGVRRVTPLHRDLGRMLHMGRVAAIRRLVLPTTVPYVVVGLQVSLSLSLALALVAEMVGNPAGVGQALIVAQTTLQPAQMFAYVIVIGVVGVLLNALFMRLASLGFPGTTSVMGTEA